MCDSFCCSKNSEDSDPENAEFAETTLREYMLMVNEKNQRIAELEEENRKLNNEVSDLRHACDFYRKSLLNITAIATKATKP